MTNTLDPAFAETLRAALVEHVERTAAARKRRWWRRAIWVSVGVVIAGGGAAAAQDLLPLPGADQVTDLSKSLTVTRTGTSTVNLGPRPDSATDVELSLKRLSAGVFTFADGASMSCSATDAAAGKDAVAKYALPLGPGQETTTITATRGARWTLTVRYSQHVPTDWGTNAHGLTYGVTSDRGQEPDLIAVVATNGKQGYVHAAELNGPAPTSPAQAQKWSRQDQGHIHSVPVYASDGTTKIGDFDVPGIARTGAPTSRTQQPTPMSATTSRPGIPNFVR